MGQSTRGGPALGRALCVFTLAASGIVVDLTGWWTTGTGSRTLMTLAVPDRRLDTRSPGGLTSRLQPRWVAVFPCAAGYQETTTVNYRAGSPVANAALVDATSGVCAQTSQPVDVILDVFGEAS